MCYKYLYIQSLELFSLDSYLIYVYFITMIHLKRFKYIYYFRVILKGSLEIIKLVRTSKDQKIKFTLHKASSLDLNYTPISATSIKRSEGTAKILKKNPYL